MFLNSYKIVINTNKSKVINSNLMKLYFLQLTKRVNTSKNILITPKMFLRNK